MAVFWSCLAVLAIGVALAVVPLGCAATGEGGAARAAQEVGVVFADAAATQSPPGAIAGPCIVVTDLDASAGPVRSLKLLLGPDTTVVRPEAASAAVLATGTRGAVVLSADPAGAADLLASVRQCAASGRTVVVDTAAWAAMTGCNTQKVATDHVRIVAESDIVSGLAAGDCLPSYGPGGLQALPGTEDSEAVKVLAVAGQSPALVEQRVGNGRVVVTDLRTPAEPYVWSVGSFYKYLFASNALGNRARLGVLWPVKPTYAELVRRMKELAAEHPAVTCRNEGRASDGQDLYSFSIGKPGGRGLLILGAVHGNEWENALGLVTFMRHAAERSGELGIDLEKVRLTIVPAVSPYGFDHISRLNANGVNLNRNGDTRWDDYAAEDTNGDGAYGPWDQDWKGAAPLSEPESQILVRLCDRERFEAALDIHSNPSGTGYNKLMSARSATPGAAEAVEALAAQFNRQIAGRYIMRQQHEKTIKPILNERVTPANRGPTLNGSRFLAGGRHSVLVELPGGFWMDDPRVSAYGTFMCTDLVSELCVAFVRTYGVRSAGETNPAAAHSTEQGEQP